MLSICYVWSVIVYGGRAATEKRDVDQAQRVCTELTERLRNKGRTLYIDNFYTSYPLAKFFLHKKIQVVGTQCKSSWFSKRSNENKSKKGEIIGREVLLLRSGRIRVMCVC